MKKVLRSYLIAPITDSMIKDLAVFYTGKKHRKVPYSEVVERAIMALHRKIK
jgi:hypothetical protein